MFKLLKIFYHISETFDFNVSSNAGLNFQHMLTFSTLKLVNITLINIYWRILLKTLSSLESGMT